VGLPYGARNTSCLNDGPGLLGPMPSGIRATGGVGFVMGGAPQVVNSNEMPRMPVNIQAVGSVQVNAGMQIVDQHIGGTAADRLGGSLRGIVDNIRGPNDNAVGGTGSGRLVGFPSGMNSSGLSDQTRIGFGGGSGGSCLDNPSGGLHSFGAGSVRSDDDGLPVARELLRSQLSAATSQAFRPHMGPGGGTRPPIPSLMSTGKYNIN